MQFQVSRISRGECSAEEWEARADLAAAYRLAVMHGLNEAIFNHLTEVVPGKPDRYYQIPFGMHWSEVNRPRSCGGIERDLGPTGAGNLELGPEGPQRRTDRRANPFHLGFPSFQSNPRYQKPRGTNRASLARAMSSTPTGLGQPRADEDGALCASSRY
jgi:hypothetical protein